MDRNPVRAMFLGTCRMHDPVGHLQKVEDVVTRSTPHRFHTTGQALGFIRHMTGAAPWRPEMMHLVSDYAAERILSKDTPREELLADLEWLRDLWPTFGCFVIEISTKREFEAETPEGKLLVNTFSQRDQERYAEALTSQVETGQSLPVLPIAMRQQTGGDMLRDMQAIKTALGGRPVIWVSHMRPGGDDPRFELVNRVRAQGAQVLAQNASLLGDRFFDPSEVVAEMGVEAFFQKDGTDIDHLTPRAAERLSEIYREMLLATSQTAAPSTVPVG